MYSPTVNNQAQKRWVVHTGGPVTNGTTKLKYMKILTLPLLILPKLCLLKIPTDFLVVTEDCWLVDKEYELDEKINVVPTQMNQR